MSDDRPRRSEARRNGDDPPAPQPLTTPVLDSHTHLDLQRAPVEQALAAAAEVGVLRVVQVGVDVETSRWSARAAADHLQLDAVVALHPNEAPKLTGRGQLAAALGEIDAMTALPQVRGVGETGLDHFRTGPAGRALQEESFRAHIDIAKKHRKALVIHDREAHADVLRVLAEEGPPDAVVFHCFSGDVEMAKICAEAGYVMSFAGNVTFKNAEALREAAVLAPRELLLVETDGPFLTPMPYRGRPNAPYLVPLIVRYLADLRGEDLDDLCDELWRTGERVFGPSRADSALL